MKKFFIYINIVFIFLCSSCTLESFGGFDSTGWEKYGDKFAYNVNWSSPEVSRFASNSGDGYADECTVEIYSVHISPKESGHYVFKGAANILTVTIAGEDYKLRVPISSGYSSGYTAHIKLKEEVKTSQIKSGYIRLSGYEGYYKIVPHEMEETGEIITDSCDKGAYKQFKCKDCTYTEKEYIEGAGQHTMTELETIYSATCYEGSHKLRVCTICGFSEKVYLSEPLKHHFVNGFCTICFCSESSNEYVSCTYSPLIQLNVSNSGLGTRTCTIEIDVYNDKSVFSEISVISTKPNIIDIVGQPTWSDGKLLVVFVIKDYGEADVLVDLVSAKLNDSQLCEIHVVVEPPK